MVLTRIESERWESKHVRQNLEERRKWAERYKHISLLLTN
jgi:hypothetical protein